MLTLPGIRVFRSPRFRSLAAGIFFAAVLVHFAQLAATSFANMNDFRGIFVPTARLAWGGAEIYRHLPLARPDEFTQGVLSANDTPVFLLLVWPWTVLPDLGGRLLWQLMELAALAATLVVVYADIGRPTRNEALVAVALVMLFPPVRDSLTEGQISIFLGLLMALALLGHQRGRSACGGLALGLAVALKLTPLLAAAYFVWKRSWRLCLWAGATGSALLVATLAVGWSRYWLPFWDVLRQQTEGSANPNNQSLNGFLLRLLRPDLSGIPIASPGLGFELAQLGLRLAIIGMVVWLLTRVRLPEPEKAWTEFSLILLAAPLLQPFAWPHHFAQATLAIPVLVHLASRRMLAPVAAAIAAAALAVAALFDIPTFAAAKAIGGVHLAEHPRELILASLTFYCVLLTVVGFVGVGMPRRQRPVPA